MGFWSNLFESREAAEKRKRQQARKVERAVERVVDNLSDKIRDMEREREKIWKNAKMKLQSGQKNEAARLLKMYKSKDIMLSRLDRQKSFVQHQLDMITGARDMQIAMGALGEMAAGMDISSDFIADSLENIDIASADINEINKTMDKAFEKNMAQLDRESESLADAEFDENLMNALETEAAGEIAGGFTATPAGDNASPVSQGSSAINEGLERIKKNLKDQQ